MRTNSEINKILEQITSKHMENPRAEDIVNTLAWVLGEELSPLEMLSE